MAASLKRPTQFHHDAHPYVPDRVTDHRGRDRCERCGLGRAHRWHKLPATDPAVAEMESRRAGERMPAGQEQADAALAVFDAAARTTTNYRPRDR